MLAKFSLRKLKYIVCVAYYVIKRFKNKILLKKRLNTKKLQNVHRFKIYKYSYVRTEYVGCSKNFEEQIYDLCTFYD